MAANPELKRLLIASIERARQVNPDRLANPAQSLEQYFEFVAWAERAIPASLLKAKPDATLYQRIDQSLALGALLKGVDTMSDIHVETLSRPTLLAAEPQLFVADVGTSCEFYTKKLGLTIAFSYGEPPFYGV